MSTVDNVADAPVKAPRKSKIAPDKPRPGRPPKPGSTIDKRRNAERVAGALKMVSDATRIQILATLAEGDMNVTQLVAATGAKSQPAVSFHLKLLRASQFVAGRRDGQSIFYSLTESGVALAKVVSTL